MARHRKGRPVDGILILNKPLGVSSNHALQSAKRLYFAQKAGHSGSLDPMATGVLPVSFGEATKFTQYLLNADKAYTATIKFGELTATGDKEGDVIEYSDASSITREKLLLAMQNFLGDIQQIPPMYSALKVDGQPLYKMAREGIEIERAARQVCITELKLIDFRSAEKPEADIYVECSKGTYIRSLAVDIGNAMGVGAHLIKLHRVRVGKFDENMSHTLVELQSIREMENNTMAVVAYSEKEPVYDALDKLLIPAEESVNHLPLVEVTGASGYYVRLGQPVVVPKSPASGLVRIREDNGIFIGVGEIMDDGRVAPRRLIVQK